MRVDEPSMLSLIELKVTAVRIAHWLVKSSTQFVMKRLNCAVTFCELRTPSLNDVHVKLRAIFVANVSPKCIAAVTEKKTVPCCFSDSQLLIRRGAHVEPSFREVFSIRWLSFFVRKP